MKEFTPLTIFLTFLLVCWILFAVKVSRGYVIDGPASLNQKNLMFVQLENRTHLAPIMRDIIEDCEIMKSEYYRWQDVVDSVDAAKKQADIDTIMRSVGCGR